MSLVFMWPISPIPRLRPISQFRGSAHTGIDMGGRGQRILAAAAGTVKVAALVSPRGPTEGRVIYLTHDGGYETHYCHLDSFCVRKGDTVSQGQNIGIIGSTGNATGPHLHFEILENNTRVDPVPYLPPNPNVGGSYACATKLPPDCPNAATATAEPQTVTKEATQVPSCR